MDTQALIEKLQAEAACPLCLDYLRDAVTIECGHNFCGSCLLGRWQGLQGTTCPCPVCCHPCRDRNPRRNTQLWRLVEAIQRLPDRRPRCEEHQEALRWFCEQDLQLLCPQCRASSDHRGHALCPIPQAADHCREKLRRYWEF